MKKRFLSVLLTMCMVLSLVPMASLTAVAQPNLTGAVPLTDSVNPESGKTYTISDATQLKRLATVVNGGNNCAGATFVLTNDIVLNSGALTADADGNPLYNGKAVDASNMPNEWTAIGNNGSKFSGTFDGDNHTVSGIYINNSSTHQGFFGEVENGTIKNVGVINSYIKGGGDVGGVCGLNDGTIENCYTTGFVSGTGGYVGGVCGLNDAQSKIAITQARSAEQAIVSAACADIILLMAQ